MTEQIIPAAPETPPPNISYLRLFSIFFRIGLTTFGGGFSMATVLRHEMVLKRRWLSEKDFIDTLAIATSVPGAVAVNLAFFEGIRLRGFWGGMVAATGQILPSLLVILIIAKFAVSYFSHPPVAAFLKGAAIAVAGQIAFAALTFARKLRIHWQNFFACGLGLIILGLGFHPVWALLAAALAGYALMQEGMARHEWTNEEELRLLGLISDMAAPELVEDTPEEEVQSLIRRRKDVVKDQFDIILEKCDVLDLDRRINRGEFFSLAAQNLAHKLDLDIQTLEWSLKTQEDAKSTVLNKWLAIPHVIVEGEGNFEMLLVRCRKGIPFSPRAGNVKALFVLAGSVDERNFYLCALATMAQITRSPGFLERWLHAKNPQELKNLILSIKGREMDR
ncbi:MAG TPA: chromate transporter [Synergistaceae bacterium]|nr:chromate transporter [Synergistaceae bacterium]